MRSCIFGHGRGIIVNPSCILIRSHNGLFSGVSLWITSLKPPTVMKLPAWLSNIYSILQFQSEVRVLAEIENMCRT